MILRFFFKVSWDNKPNFILYPLPVTPEYYYIRLIFKGLYNVFCDIYYWNVATFPFLKKWDMCSYYSHMRHYKVSVTLPRHGLLLRKRRGEQWKPINPLMIGSVFKYQYHACLWNTIHIIIHSSVNLNGYCVRHCPRYWGYLSE